LPELWGFALSGVSGDWAAWAKLIMQHIPADEDAAATGHYVFSDTLVAASYALDTAVRFAPQDAAWTASLAHDTTDAFAQEGLGFGVYTSAIEQLLRSNAVVQEELVRQERDLAELEATPCDNAIDAVRLRVLGESTLPIAQLQSSLTQSDHSETKKPGSPLSRG
jgi:hypothetical protein